MKKNIKVISHDKNGGKIFADSILRDTQVNEYFIPELNQDTNEYGDWFMDDFFPLESEHLEVIRKHGTMEDLRNIMRKSTDRDAMFNVEGRVNI